MKLYTEEQLHNTVIAISNYLDDIDLSKAQEKIEKHLKALKPIELPSDEEIIKGYDAREFQFISFWAGAAWCRNKILNQNK